MTSSQPADENEKVSNSDVFSPKIDIYEDSERIVLVTDIPGSDEESLELILEDRVFTISGLCQPETFEGCALIHNEHISGGYQRIVTLPTDVDGQAIKASLKNGVLTVTLPVLDSQSKKKIVAQSEEMAAPRK